MANLILTKPRKGSSSGGIFGSEYHDAESLTVSTTTGTTFIEKVRLTTASIPAGDYRITWSFQWNHNAQNSDFEGTVILDGGTPPTYLAVYKVEPKDAGAAAEFLDPPTNVIPYDGLDGVGPLENYSTTLTAQRYEYSGFAVKTLPSGIHFVTINFRSDEFGDESSMWNARLDLWRVR